MAKNSNYYCAGSQCRKTTRRVRVRMSNRTYIYCVDCGRRLEMRSEQQAAVIARPKVG